MASKTYTLFSVSARSNYALTLSTFVAESLVEAYDSAWDSLSSDEAWTREGPFSLLNRHELRFALAIREGSRWHGLASGYPFLPPEDLAEWEGMLDFLDPFRGRD